MDLEPEPEPPFLGGSGSRKKGRLRLRNTAFSTEVPGKSLVSAVSCSTRSSGGRAVLEKLSKSNADQTKE